MAFTSTNDDEFNIAGGKVIRTGTFTNADESTTGGDITTGLSLVEHMTLQYTGTAVATASPVIAETFPLAGSAVTIVTLSAKCGVWMAYGEKY